MHYQNLERQGIYPKAKAKGGWWATAWAWIWLNFNSDDLPWVRQIVCDFIISFCGNAECTKFKVDLTQENVISLD